MNMFEGVLPALLTPLHADGSLNEASVAALLERIYSAGCHGVYVAGNTGEGLLLPLALREQLAALVRQLSPSDKSVIVHIGANNTADSLRLARHASSLGVTAISSLPPAGGYPFSEIRAFYEALAAASDAPLLVYFFPGVAPAIHSYAQLAELCAIANVAGLKFTNFDFYTLSRIKKLGKVVFNGHDEALVCGLLMGADGGIGSFYNFAPELFVELYNAARAGDWTRARNVQDRVNELISIVLEYPFFPALKDMQGWQGVDCGPCVAPRQPMSEDQSRRLRGELVAAGFLPG